MSDRNDTEPADDDPTALAEGEPIHTTTIGIIGGTAQVDVALPSPADDDFDDDVVDDGYLDDNITTGDIPVGALTHPPAPARTDDSAGAAPDEDVQEHPGDAPHADDAVSGLTDAAEASTPDTVQADTVQAEIVEGADVAVDEGAEDRDAVDADIVQDDEGAPRDETVPDEAAPDEAVPEGAAPDQAEPDEAAGVIPIAPAVAVVVTPASTAAETDVARAPEQTPSGSVPTTRRSAHHAGEQRHATERVAVVRAPEVLQSRRLGDLEPGRESSDLLTPERMLDPSQVVRAEPEGAWQRFVYAATAHRVNLGDGKRARARKALDHRISAPLAGGAKFVPVLSRKGGVGKTTVTTLLGMALADARDDRVIAIDANPDRGTLADRVGRSSGKTVRDLVRVRKDVVGFNDLSSIVGRDETRLDVLASDTDPHVSEALSDRDYHDVASIAAHYYSIVLTDTGTGIVHSVMGATLGLSDQLVIVAGLSLDEARLASETLTWLESNGFAEQVKNAVVVLNTARPGTPVVRADELATHFRTRVRTVLHLPYDPHLAAGSAVTFRDLAPATREAARQLAAAVVEGLRQLTPAA